MIERCIFCSVKTFIQAERLIDFQTLDNYLLYDMKLINLYPLLIVAAFIAAVMNSCSPTLSPVAPTTLDLKSKTRNSTSAYGGILKVTTDTNFYVYKLSCGCPFPLAVDASDTTWIHYDLSHLKDTTDSHVMSATPKSPLVSGQHTGWIAITTIQPVTTELLKDTLRDTVIVP